MGFLRKCIYVYVAFLHICLLVKCTSDLNYLKLQMVADHLTEEECHKVYEALQMRHFFLEHSLSGTELPDIECIDLLGAWDKAVGQNKTFHDLSLRLKEIGRKDVADKLSTAVFHEEASILLDDFRELEDPESDLMNGKHKAERDEKLLEENFAATPEDSLMDHFVWLFGGAGILSGIGLALVLINKFAYPICGKAQSDGSVKSTPQYSKIRLLEESYLDTSSKHMNTDVSGIV